MSDPDPISMDLRLSNAEIEELIRKFERGARKPPRLLTPLPRRVRLRLAIEGAVNHVATWLVYRGHYDAAERVWRAFGMWRR